LACTSSPSSMPMILRFGLSMESLGSCIFLSQLLSYLTKSSSVFSLISISSLSSEILSSTCSSLLEWPSTVFFVWLNGLFISRIYVWFFSEVFHIFVQLLFCILYCYLQFMYLSFYNVLCFTLVVVEVFSEFIYFCVFSCYFWCLKISQVRLVHSG
jgi:hypothetical protein